MSKVIVGGKTYMAEPIATWGKPQDEDTNIPFGVPEVRVYQLNAALEKYLVLTTVSGKTQDFVLTGFDKFSELRNHCASIILAQRDIVESNKDLEKIWEQHYNKRLKRVDHEKLQRAVSRYYEEHYPLFIYRGLSLEALLNHMEKELA